MAIARQSLAAASLTSPISGTVAQVAMAVGDRVGAASSTATISVLGRHSYLVATSIPLTEIDLVTVRQTASVVVDGISAPLSGTVSEIGIIDDSSSGTPSYPVTIALDATTNTLFDGSGATLSIDVGSVPGVLTVPTSAVHTNGVQHTVSVLDGTVLKTVTVQIGLVGTDLTQIISGITAGTTVVIADVEAPLPTAQTAGNARFAGGGLGGGAVDRGALVGGGGARLPAGGFNRPGR